VEEFSTPDGLGVEACAEAALGYTPSLEQVTALEQASGAAAQIELLTRWLTSDSKGLDSGGTVTVRRLGAVVEVAGAGTGREVLEKLAAEHAVYGLLRYEDGTLVGEGEELQSQKLMLDDAPASFRASELVTAEPSVWENVVREVTEFQPEMVGSQLLQRIGHRLSKLSVAPPGEFNNTQAASVASVLQCLKVLEAIEFICPRTKVGDAGAVAIGNNLQNLEQLLKIVLDFEDTKIGDAGAVAIGSNLQDLKQLQQITLNFRGSKVSQATKDFVKGQLTKPGVGVAIF